MNYEHICTKRSWDEDGVTKTKWYRVGVLKETAGGRKYITLFQQPDTTFYVFAPNEEDDVNP